MKIILITKFDVILKPLTKYITNNYTGLMPNPIMFILANWETADHFFNTSSARKNIENTDKLTCRPWAAWTTGSQIKTSITILMKFGIK